jgi:hypothetical protein
MGRNPIRSPQELDRRQHAPVDIQRLENPFGFTYHNEPFSQHVQDRPTVVLETRSCPTVLGQQGLGVAPAGTRIAFMNTADISPWFTMFNRLIEKCELPPYNYTPSTQELTSSLNFYKRFNQTLYGAWNLKILNQLRQLVMVNEGMYTLYDDFAGKYRRISELIDLYRSIRVFPLIDRILDKYCNVLQPYPGGPIYAQLLDAPRDSDFAGTNPCTQWTVAIDLDRGVTSADVVKKLLDDIQSVWYEMMGQSVNADFNTDQRLISNIMGALGFPTLKLELGDVRVDPLMFSMLQFHGLFCFDDNQGAGADTQILYPVWSDVDDTAHLTWPAGYHFDDLDFMGILPYAGNALEQAISGQDVACWGVISPGLWLDLDGDAQVVKAHRVHTIEDGWTSTLGNVDMSAADTVQDYIWKYPWISRHMYGPTAVGVQESEELYWYYGPEQFQEYDVRLDDFAIGYYVALHRKEYGGFDVPVSIG